MQVDDPPYLPVGTAVSAKYKGAFCEAKVSKVVRVVKCKVTYKMGLGNATVNDDQIKGPLRVGQVVQVKHPEKKEFVEATIMKIQDCSQYTVVFDDGDITTLRRTALCLKSGRHFNESETLDQLPLTHPEHFSNPVVVGRRGRRNRQLKEDSSDGEAEEEAEPDLEGYQPDIGRVVSVESTEKKRSKENWFPGLIVVPTAQPSGRINIKDEFLIRSFKDGRYYTVPKKETSEFTKDMFQKVESPSMAEAVERAVKYLDTGEMPVYWEKSLLFSNTPTVESDSEDNFTDTSDDEPIEEKDRFVAELYKYMDEAGTPLNKTPSIGNKDVDLHRLFRVVQKLGGYNRVTNKNKWKIVSGRLHLPSNQNTYNQVKAIYKKCLASYETFHRALGVTMLNHTRSNTKKTKGRSLIRDKDRATPININSPKSQKDDDDEVKKDEPSVSTVTPTSEITTKPKRKDTKKDVVDKKKEKDASDANKGEASDTNSSSDAATDAETTTAISNIAPITPATVGRPKRFEKRTEKAKEAKKGKSLVEKIEETVSKENEKDEEKTQLQQTRSKSQTNLKQQQKDQATATSAAATCDKKEQKKENESKALASGTTNTKSKMPIKKEEEKKQRGRKRTNNVLDEKPETPEGPSTCNVVTPSSSTTATSQNTMASVITGPQATAVNIGDKLKVYYGPTHESKVTYEAKVIEIDKESSEPIYLVHYTGWNTRYDEWITVGRIAENLSATTKAKRIKNNSQSGVSVKKSDKTPLKRGRGMSITGRSTSVSDKESRAATPSITRTKSPATPATRSASRLNTRLDSATTRRGRRISTALTESAHSDSDSEVSESEGELSRTRSGNTTSINKEDETPNPPLKTYKRKTKIKAAVKKEEQPTPPITADFKDDDEDVVRPKRARKLKKASESDEDSNENPPKGRDFDLNQIRSELKGFTKLKTNIDVGSKEVTSSASSIASDDNSNNSISNNEVPPPPPMPPVFEVKKEEEVKMEVEKVKEEPTEDDIYEFKEPEPFEFEKSKLGDEKGGKKRMIPRVYQEETNKKMRSSPVKNEETMEEKNKQRFRKSPFKKAENEQLIEQVVVPQPVPSTQEIVKKEDAFDKLVGSPSFNNIKTTAVPFTTNNDKPEPSVFKADFSGDFSLTDDNKKSIMDVEVKSKDSDDDDLIQQQIQKVIQNSSSTDDDESVDNLLSLSFKTKIDAKTIQEKFPNLSVPTTETETDVKDELIIKTNEDVDMEKNAKISPALQETDKSLLDSIVAQSPPIFSTKVEASPSLPIKTGTRIADSILQKFNSIKNMKAEVKDTKVIKEAKVEAPVVMPLKVERASEEKDTKVEVKKEAPVAAPTVIKKELVTKKELTLQMVAETSKKLESRVNKPPSTSSTSTTGSSFEGATSISGNIIKKRKKVKSRAYIESDSDSSDSEQLVIARSDEDSSQTLDTVPEISSATATANIASSAAKMDKEIKQQPEKEKRNFQFEAKEALLPAKEEEPDSQLHSLLLCEETFPRSPAPAPSVDHLSVVQETKKISIEMPFASAPGTSNSLKSAVDTNKTIVKNAVNAVLPAPLAPQQIPIPVTTAAAVVQQPQLIQRVVDVSSATTSNANVVMENTPPTTPESSISNLSPRGDLSPNTGDNESCKSNDIEDYQAQRRNSNQKIPSFSEEDTQISIDSNKVKNKDEAPTKRRRKSFRAGQDENCVIVAPAPVKRGRKPQNRSRHNSDSDDTSEHSNLSTIGGGIDRNRSPRPSKYNFFVEFDPSLDSNQRIAVLQQKLAELRKTYADVKTELAAVERRRKKIKRREREAQKAARQEMACA